MKSRISALTLSIAVLVASAAHAFAQKPEDLAQQSASAWLTLVDSENYAQSWQEASATFKAAVNQERWREMIKAARDPLGKVLSRKVTSANATKTLPGAPDGDYVVIQYATTFEHKQSAIETAIPMLDKDGKWRVSGYFIK